MQNNVIDLWRIPGVNDLKPRQLSALYQLLIFRDSLARSQNKPHFKVISNQALLEIAQTLPKYPEELTLLPSLAKSQIARYGKGLLQAVKQAQKANTPPRNGNHRINESVMMRKERLMQWRKMAGFRMGVPSDVVLPKDVLSVIAEANPRSMEELQSTSPCDLLNMGKRSLGYLKVKGNHETTYFWCSADCNRLDAFIGSERK